MTTPAKRTDLRSIVAAAVRLQREAAGLSQKRLAELSGLSLPTVQRLETDDSTVELRTLEKVAAGLGVAPAILLRRAKRAA